MKHYETQTRFSYLDWNITNVNVLKISSAKKINYTLSVKRIFFAKKQTTGEIDEYLCVYMQQTCIT